MSSGPRGWRTDLGGRCRAAAIVGFVLGLGVWAALRLFASGAMCDWHRSLDCLALALLWFPLFVAVAALLGYLGLRVLKVWLAGPVAAIGLVVTWILLQFGSQVHVDRGAVYVIVVVPVAYVLAALLTGPTTPAWWVRAIIAVAIAALIPAGYQLRDVVGKQRVQQVTIDYPHPLYAPDLPGYTTGNAHVGLGLPESFRYSLYNGDGKSITVEQKPVAPDAPAPICRDGTVQTTCPTVAPGVWFVGEAGIPSYEARLGDQSVTVKTYDQVPLEDVRTAATRMKVRTPDHFGG